MEGDSVVVGKCFLLKESKKARKENEREKNREGKQAKKQEE